MTYADPNKPYEVCETEKKTFIVPVGWKRENVRTFILLCLSFIAGEVAGYAYRDAFDFVTDNSDEDGDILCDEFDLYEQFKCTGRMRREERGIITRHGIINSLHPDNPHASMRIREGARVAEGVELYVDGRCGRYFDDYYLETPFPTPEGDMRWSRLYWVLRSDRVTALRKYLRQVDDDTRPIPKKLII